MRLSVAVSSDGSSGAIPFGIFSMYAATWPYGDQGMVTAVYSTDNWATTQTAPLTSQGNNNMWSLNDPLNLPPNTTVTWAVLYSVGGATFWDNNNGANYTATVPAQ